jgi:hypothetical protein
MSGIIFIESYMIWIENGNSRLILHLKMNFCGAMGYAARLAYIKPPHVGGCYNIIRGNWQGMRRKV